MIILLINKILIMLFVIACLNTARHTYYFIQAFLQSTTEEPVKYKLRPYTLLLLGVSIAYVLTTLFTGIKI